MLESVDGLVLPSVLGLLKVLGLPSVLGLLNVLGLLSVLGLPSVLLVLLSELGLFSPPGLLSPELVVAPGPRGRTGPPRLFLVRVCGWFSVEPTRGEGLGSAGAGVSVVLRVVLSGDALGAQLTPGVITGDACRLVGLAGLVTLPGLPGLCVWLCGGLCVGPV